jgi:ATP-dependent DNA helicase DinG
LARTLKIQGKQQIACSCPLSKVLCLEQAQSNALPQITLPDIPAMVVSAREAYILSPDGEIMVMPHDQAREEIKHKCAFVCHAPYTRHKLGSNEWAAFDLLELFAFVHPAKFCVPTPHGLAVALGISVPEHLEDYPFTLIEAAQALLSDIQQEGQAEDQPDKKMDIADVAHAMGLNGKGWGWSSYILSALGREYNENEPIITKSTLNVWRHLPEWSEHAPPPPASHMPVSAEESRERLSAMLGGGTEPREQQIEYAEKVSEIFDPVENEDVTLLALAEAGTGTGKTLGYLSPASVWSEKNHGTTWVSTYTKNLQRQIDQELDKLYPTAEIKNAKVAVRKGRENYLCLLNLDDAVAGAALAKYPDKIVGMGIMARWAEASKDGDLSGSDFPGWLSGILGYANTLALSDKRGECIYSACDHYHKCFVERSIRRAAHADIVIANHALVMIQTAISSPNEMLPQRYVFDEGHHLFDAADSAFAGHLTARETHDLRRWILGPEGGRRKSRARGLKRRVEDLLDSNGEAERLLDDVIHSASALPALGWSKRMKDKLPQGGTEHFLALVYQQVMARSPVNDTPYSLETDTKPLIEGLGQKAKELQAALRNIQHPLRRLSKILKEKMNDHADTMDSDTRKRIESVTAGMDRRSENTLAAWIDMLETLFDNDIAAEEFVDWMEITRIDGQSIDVGMYRHWIDPMKPFASAIKPHAHGIVVTSATLRDGTDDDEANWEVARQRTGAPYISKDALEMSLPSPFDYGSRTKIFIVNDVNKNNMEQIGSAYRELFLASGGGALGLFTAIQRLRHVHNNIVQPLEDAGLALYGQHIDDMDTGTLVDIFRDDTHACLLGTDAVRDGIDIPGDSLRLLVYDRVPWPRPTILHKARKARFGGRIYDEMMTRSKLQQAYGRLIRKADDRGVFVMMDSGLPTRLLGAFPADVEIQRTGLADTIEQIKDFL